MINSTAFDYVNVLTKAADASYQREAILANSLLLSTRDLSVLLR